MKVNAGEILKKASQMGASSVLFLVGHPPVARLGRELQPPFTSVPLTFNDTQELAETLLTDLELNNLNVHGSVELPFEIAGVKGIVTVFYGGGSHNLVFYLKP